MPYSTRMRTASRKVLSAIAQIRPITGASLLSRLASAASAGPRP